MNFTYMDAIGLGYPTVGCHCVGDGSIYANIVWDNGDTIPLQAELDSWILSYTQQQMALLIEAERDHRVSSSGYLVGSNWFNSDSISRIQQMALTMMGANMPNGIMWKTMSGTFVQMTPTLATQIFQSAASSDMTLFSVCQTKIATMMASSTPGTFDYLGSWPKGYGE